MNEYFLFNSSNFELIKLSVFAVQFYQMFTPFYIMCSLPIEVA